MRAALLVPIVGNVGRFGRSAAGGNMRRGNVGTVRVNVVRAILAVLFCTGSAFADVSFQGLGDLPGGTYGSWAYGVSADGSVVVGYGRSASGAEAFRWTQDGMVSLGGLPGVGYDPSNMLISAATSVSADGSVVVGYARSGEGKGNEAFIWDEINGMRSLLDVLKSHEVPEVAGWSLALAKAISADGLTIVGYGVNPSGQSEAWRATLGHTAVVPVPGAVLLGMLGLGYAGMRLRRQAS